MVVPRASLVQASLDIFWKVGMNGEFHVVASKKRTIVDISH